jgi:protein gp37
MKKMGNSGIDYLDKAGNSMYGCKHGCPYCFGEQMVGPRLRGKVVSKNFKWDQPEYCPERIDMLKSQYPSAVSKNPNLPKGEVMVGVNFIADMFGEWVPKEYIESVLKAIPEYNQYLFLTKNPARYGQFADLLRKKNIWLGTTVEDETHLDRLIQLRNVKWTYFGHSYDIDIGTKFWVSVEPLLGPLNCNITNGDIDWVVMGACTGKMASQPEYAWMEKIRNDCLYKDIPLFIKDNVKAEWTKQPRFKEFPKW